MRSGPLLVALLPFATTAAAQSPTAPSVSQSPGESGTMPDDCPAYDPASAPSRQPPTYPPVMAEQGLSGVVMLVLTIDRCGRIAEARMERGSGYPEFDQAALEAAMRWRMTPAYRDGEAVTSRVRRPVRFELLEDVP
ncbi:energy transducer TonB [Lysobacter sp. cf310]|uniref:energy transducer TonB n=1 Tax=Lysobacter sp. cf310 TaxID=1761790 RepID=UPI000A5A36B3|nr:energy transducer TonB [Lysobacter sp. cf310]